ncbi:PHP domain-containing protein [Vulgatibacter sp.]|uniref:PHP domain-containing protein n=1 Tax=Vulgatibacter sp. TaxID=1971226 RepID=UPI003568521B
MTLRFDVHVHSARSVAGAPTADRLVRLAEQAGLDGLVLTELGERWSERELVSLRQRTETQLIVLSAEYLIVDDVSLLAYGFSGSLPPLDDLETAIGRIRAEGGTAVVAYPFDDGAPSLQRLVDLGVQGIEVYSANGELPTDQQLEEARRLGLFTVAGSGFRGGSGTSVGDCHTLIDADVRSGRDLAVAIRSGRARAVFGPPPRAAAGHRAPVVRHEQAQAGASRG